METYTSPVKTVRVYRQRNAQFLVYYKLRSGEQVKREIANASSICWPGENLQEEKVRNNLKIEAYRIIELPNEGNRTNTLYTRRIYSLAVGNLEMQVQCKSRLRRDQNYKENLDGLHAP